MLVMIGHTCLVPLFDAVASILCTVWAHKWLNFRINRGYVRSVLFIPPYSAVYMSVPCIYSEVKYV